MRHNLNSAAKAIAVALGGTIGVKRIYGGADDSARMQITWQVVKGSRPIGMIDLICQDGVGKDGMEWFGEIRISGPGIYHQETLITPWHKVRGRRAKRLTRRRFFMTVDQIIERGIKQKPVLHLDRIDFLNVGVQY